METLTTFSATKTFVKNKSNTTLNSPKSLMGRSGISLSWSRSFCPLFSYSLSLQNRPTRLFTSSSHMAFDPEVLTGSGNAEGETEFQEIKITMTTHVKFLLEKECLYGEQFLLVGDDPALGSWNPSNGVPLTWTDGHKWTVEMPGSDRIFRAWETKNTIIIAEDWANAEFQKIMEDQMIDENADQGLDLFSGPVGSKYMTRLTGELTDKLDLDAVLSDTEEEVTLQDFVRSADDDFISEKELRSLSNENLRIVADEETLFTHEEGPLLVPGLNPLPVMSSGEAISKEFRKPINAED